MKKTTIAMLILAIAVVLYILIPGLSWTDDRRLFHSDHAHTGTHLRKQMTNHCAGSPSG